MSRSEQLFNLVPNINKANILNNNDLIGRKKMLIFVAFLYAISAVLSAMAGSYELLYVARIIGGLAFGAALVLAPMYIAEISTAENRGKLVSLQQLNIVFGFFAAFLSNYFFNKYNTPDSTFLNDENVWRWMLGVEFVPVSLRNSIYIYFLDLFNACLITLYAWH